MSGNISKAFAELDHFSQEQISRDPEFSPIFPEKHLARLDCHNDESMEYDHLTGEILCILKICIGGFSVILVWIFIVAICVRIF